MNMNKKYKKQIGEQFPTASNEEMKILEELFEMKEELMLAMIRSFNDAESEQSEYIESRINSVMSDWLSTDNFLDYPIYWQSMLEVLLTKCSMIVDGKDYREYYKAITDPYVKALVNEFGKEAIEQEIDWYYKH